MANVSSPAIPNSAPAYRLTAQGRDFKLGVLSALATVFIWSCFLLSMRAGAVSALTTFDLALMRFVLPGLVLLPWVMRDWRLLMSTSPWMLLGVCVGAGVPFFYLSSLGASYAPAAHSGLLIPGTFPLFVTAIAVLVFKEPISSQRLVGLLCIGLGVLSLVLMSMLQGGGELWKGDLIFLLAAFFWAVYTICLRLAGLPPLAITGLLCLVSSVILGLLYISGQVSSGMADTPLLTVMTQFIVQAVLVGIVAGFTYGFAINLIGAELSAAIGSLTPVLVSLFAIPLLNESLSMASGLGLALVCSGVVLASGLSLRSIFSR